MKRYIKAAVMTDNEFNAIIPNLSSIIDDLIYFYNFNIFYSGGKGLYKDTMKYIMDSTDISMSCCMSIRRNATKLYDILLPITGKQQSSWYKSRNNQMEVFKNVGKDNAKQVFIDSLDALEIDSNYLFTLLVDLPAYINDISTTDIDVISEINRLLAEIIDGALFVHSKIRGRSKDLQTWEKNRQWIDEFEERVDVIYPENRRFHN